MPSKSWKPMIWYSESNTTRCPCGWNISLLRKVVTCCRSFTPFPNGEWNIYHDSNYINICMIIAGRHWQFESTSRLLFFSLTAGVPLSMAFALHYFTENILSLDKHGCKLCFKTTKFHHRQGSSLEREDSVIPTAHLKKCEKEKHVPHYPYG